MSYHLGRRSVAAVVGILLATGLLGTAGAAPSDPNPIPDAATDAAHADCTAPAAGQVGCLAAPLTGAGGQPMTLAEALDTGLRPFTAADLQDAYKLPSRLLGARQTVAIVAPFDNPNAAADLAVYRRENGLPPCTAAFPCFRKVNQDGGTQPPPTSRSWGLSINAAVQLVAAACPNCHVLLVSANTATLLDLGIAMRQAVAQGADVIVPIYGALEYPEQGQDAATYDHPGVPVVAPAGDDGFVLGAGQLVPAAYDTVVAVGGTSLFRDSNARGWSETASRLSTSGCSLYVAKPAWQRDSLCDTRTVADVAAVAAAATPVAVYNTFGFTGWIAANGTTLSAALVAGTFPLAGNTATITAGEHLYRNHRQLFDVTSGSNGECRGSALCTSGRGYDGPTGLGTPNGIGAF